MVVIVFRSRLREDVSPDIEQVGLRMYELASSMPGFISYKDFVAEDGENVSIVEFESLDSHAVWREHPEHKVVQERGRTEFFESYHIQVCAPVRSYSFEKEQT
jgi:heme-degrading monooxygenase HmoA